MTFEQVRWTSDMVHHLPDDGNRYEVVDGALLVSRAPESPHRRAIQRLFLLLYPYLAAHGIGTAIWAPAEVEFDSENLVGPDLFVVPFVDGREPHSWAETDRLILAVEVLSPSTNDVDRLVKRRLYQRRHVPEYWMVDLDVRTIERWRPEDTHPAIAADRLDWQPRPSAPPLKINVIAYFGTVLGE
ncbi:MAG TPA: Uma2 family endonuclease [Gemmatimonadaceae bacterium]|nr:Uma2 family endonuclease [Gemmatimonadaceae bacterium]